MRLFDRIPHPHKIQNTNRLHRLEMRGFNNRIAVNITRAVGTMWCVYAFILLAILGFPALNALLGTYVAIYVVWISQTFLQLVFLPVLSVGQGVLGRKQELQGDESFHIAQNSEHDLEQIMMHLTVINGQLVELLEKKIMSEEEYWDQIYEGDCLQVLKTLPDNSIDSLVTDPP